MTATGSPDDGAWHRLSPLSPLVSLGRGVIALVLIGAPALFAGGRLGGLIVWAFVVPLGVAGGVVSWLVTRWRVYDGALQKEEGLIRRQSLRFPLSQIQAIDVIRPGPARLLGLAELRLQMGGATHGTARLAYLPVRQAAALRSRLLGLAGSTEQPVQRAAEPERVLARVPTARLIASLALGNESLSLLAIAAVAVKLAGASGIAVYALPALAGLWRRFNGDYHLTVAEAGEGLRLHGGLVATTAETIPRGRVQAVKLIEPLLWRPFGWCRLQVDLAGGHSPRAEETPEARRARSLLPVGHRREAQELLRHVLRELPEERLRPPGRARLKSPLRFHNLAWGRTERCVVTRSGRLTRVTAWVPLEKVQSLRRVQGPLQRALRLETIHVDTAGRGVRAALRDRDTAEGERALVELIRLCRHARQERSIASGGS